MSRSSLHYFYVQIMLCAWLLGLVGSSLVQAEENEGGPKELKGIKYRLIGPAMGGRCSRACGVIGDPMTYYVATASGGVWKSEDAGQNWKPIFDDQPISSIGSIVVAPSDSNVVYVGSGEANIRGNVGAGNGIYKSTDGGKTWKHVWKQEGQIGHMIVHPRNANVAYAAVLGHAFGPNPERGVYRTTDGGRNWEHVLKKDKDTGAIDVCFDPNNPRILYAALWQGRRLPWDIVAGGPGSGLYKSTDGGDTWKELKGKGLPKGVKGRIGVTVAPSDSNRVYAIIEAKEGGLYRSDDAGKTWKLVHKKGDIQMRPWYFSQVRVHPRDPDEVWIPNVLLHKSVDGGKTFAKVKPQPHHVDHHDIWFDPTNPQRIVNANDGGVDFTLNGGKTWQSPQLPITQFYHINTDTSVPYKVMGNMQDLGTASGPSNSLVGDDIRIGHWHRVGGGETGFSVPDPFDPNIVYSGEYSGILTRYDHRTRQAKSITKFPFQTSGFGAGDIKYRFQWTAPILVSRHDPKTVYHGANVLFRTRDGGHTWKQVSKDLTTDDKDKQKWAGGPITGDNTSAEYFCTIFSLAESPLKQGVLWAGSDDGLVHITRNGGETWTDVTKNIPGMPPLGTVSCIEASPFHSGTAYIVVDCHRLDNMKPYLYKTTDFGKTWTNLSRKMPQDIYLHVVRCDPKDSKVLYVGTERGVSFTLDGGMTWEPLKLNMPTVAVHDLSAREDDLVVGTNGRSIWILDDLTPVRTLHKIRKNKTHLFDIPTTIQWRYATSLYSALRDPAMSNPPAGAIIHYHLAGKSKEVLLKIYDSKGQCIRTIKNKKKDKDAKTEVKEKLPTKPGLHRVIWNFRHDGSKPLKGAIKEGADAKVGPLAVPGKYTVKLFVDDQDYTTDVEVKADPRSQLTQAERKQQLAFLLKLHKDIDTVVETVLDLRTLKKQLESRNKLVTKYLKNKKFVNQNEKLINKLDELEAELHNPKAKVAYDILAQKGGAKLYSQLCTLLGYASRGEGVPNQGLREVYADQANILRRLVADWDDLKREASKLNKTATTMRIPTVIIPR
ncbi:MAG: glycosyl hydrolase [Gemmataceae bacterium]